MKMIDNNAANSGRHLIVSNEILLKDSTTCDQVFQSMFIFRKKIKNYLF